MNILRGLSVVLGIVLVMSVLLSALETVVLPQQGFTRIARVVFALWHRVLIHETRRSSTAELRRALFAPFSLVSLPLAWMVFVIIGFSFIFWGSGIATFRLATEISGSSVTTLGFAKPSAPGLFWVSFIEAILGLGLVALLISYLPTIYAAYNQREKGIDLVVLLAGSPPSSVDLLEGLQRTKAVGTSTIWSGALSWLIDLEQSHTSFPALCYLPPQKSRESWVAAVGSVLDAAALLTSASSGPVGEGPALVLTYGSQCLARIGRAAGLPIDEVHTCARGSSGAPHVPPSRRELSVRREEYERAVDRLESLGVAAVADRDMGWERFAGWRGAYDRPLRGLAGISHAAPAPMTTDRPARVGRPRLVGQRPVRVDWSPGTTPCSERGST